MAPPGLSTTLEALVRFAEIGFAPEFIILDRESFYVLRVIQFRESDDSVAITAFNDTRINEIRYY